jgi:molybdenum cofactor sulfurtransferase
LRGAFDAGYRCNTDNDILDGIPVGIVRVTLGAMSTLDDVDALVNRLSQVFVENEDHLQATAEACRTKKEWILDSRCPSVSEVAEIRIDPTTPRREEDADAVSTRRRMFPWLRKRRRWLSALIQLGG